MKKTAINQLLIPVFMSVLLVLSCSSDENKVGVCGSVKGTANTEVHLAVWPFNSTNHITNVVATLTPDKNGNYEITDLDPGTIYNITIYTGSTRPTYDSQSTTKGFLAQQGMYVVDWTYNNGSWSCTTRWEY